MLHNSYIICHISVTLWRPDSGLPPRYVAVEGMHMLDAFARAAVRDIDSETLNLFAAVRPRNLQGKLTLPRKSGAAR